METLGNFAPGSASRRPLAKVCHFSLLVSLLLGSSSFSRAANHTNAIFDVSLTLSGYYQDIQTFVIGPTSAVFYLTALPASVGTAELLSAIKATVPAQYSSGTLLFRTTDAGTSDAASSFIFRKGSSNYDLSSIFAFALPPEFPTVSAIANLTATTSNQVDRTIMRFALGARGFNLDVQGPTTFNSTSIVLGGKVVSKEPYPITITSSVAGSGLYQNKPLIFSGTLQIYNRRFEIVNGP